MERALITQNRHWDNKPYENLFNRNLVNSILTKIKLKEIQVLLGVRRSGKSTIFKLLINHLSKKAVPQSILYVNLDDPLFSEVWKDAKELYRVIETSEKITKKKVRYLFLDEVQNVRGWEKFVKSVYDAELFEKIFITGSNSSLLNGGYARLLSGRYITDYVYPLSFHEILKTKNIVTYKDLVSNKPWVLSLLDEILSFGSFPEIYKMEDPDLKREVILSYYDTIILKDCVAIHGIRDIKTFKELSLYLISNIASLYSYNSLARAVKSNENTVREFVNILEDSFLISETRHYSYSLKTQSRTKKKVYCIDNSFISNVSFRFSDNRGKLLENMVYAELAKNGYREIFYFLDQKECDFIFKKEKDLIALQVAYGIDASNIDREVQGILAAMNKLNIKKGFIITYDTEQKLGENILMVPFWKLYEEVLV
ncbi:MAG: ATP-binding protein [Nitrospirae bacterium]|nr:ATP-binding protein [Nitrospirota bacterium]